MNKLSKEQISQRDELSAKLRTALDEIQAAHSEANAKIREINEELDRLYGEYNAVVENANEFVQTIASDMQSYYDDRSEKWQEGDAGQNYQEKISEFEGFTLDEAEFQPLEELDEEYKPDTGADELDNLPEDFKE